jgi:hypothetical protein
MKIDLAKLNFTFEAKPLLIGGKAMEYYGLRMAGNDIDFVIIPADYQRLARAYPEHLKDLWGDLGVCPFEFEIWQSICLFDYDYLSAGALDQGEYLVISLEKLLFLKALAMMKSEKYHKDLEMIVQKMLDDHYAAWWGAISEERRQHYLAKKQSFQA